MIPLKPTLEDLPQSDLGKLGITKELILSVRDKKPNNKKDIDQRYETEGGHVYKELKQLSTNPDHIANAIMEKIKDRHQIYKSDIIKDSNILDIMNMFGSITVGYVCYLRKAWQPLFLNCSWFVVGMISLILNFEI